MISPDDVLQFWFGAADGAGLAAPRREWFAKDAAFDEACRRAFADAWAAARDGALDHWQDTPRRCLALVILLDQIPRNIFRGDPRSFSSDFKALEVSRAALERGFDENLSPFEMLFLLLPLEHSERLDDQEQCLALVERFPPGPVHERVRTAARQHRDIVARFGRFPHRNAVLGRPTTPEEAAFLQGPDSSF